METAPTTRRQRAIFAAALAAVQTTGSVEFAMSGREARQWLNHVREILRQQNAKPTIGHTQNFYN